MSECNCGLKDKITERIKYLESTKTTKEDIEFDDYNSPNYEIMARIEELEKLSK